MTKKRTLRLTALLLLTAMLLLLCPSSALAVSFEDGLPSLGGASTVYFATLDGSRVLARKDSGKRIAPSSTAKMMAGLVAIELIGDRLQEPVTVTDAMLTGVEGTYMELAAGDTLTYYDLLCGMICGGYNDAAYVLAHALCGSADAFVERMNIRALELGLSDTVYKNPSGYDKSGMYTTLTDVVRLATHMTGVPLYMEISSLPQYTVHLIGSQQEIRVHNRNALFSQFYQAGYTNRYADGLIAGMTDAGYCTVTLITIRGIRYLCAVMGATKVNGEIHSYKLVNSLTDYAYERLGYTTVLKAGQTVCSVPLRFANPNHTEKTSELRAEVTEDVTVFVPVAAEVGKDITYRYYLYRDEQTAPVQKGTRLGTVDVLLGDELLCSVQLVAAEGAEANAFLLWLESVRRFLLSRGMLLSLLCCICLLTPYLVHIAKQRKKTASKVYYRYFSS